ncbi:hypothetical protein Syun_003090 [Stephania yunnanensis]|uniref:Uncharacterized protein n=1 Tax=Stephania yunnanensis TaxID=152371 RepID=A0AAP0PZV7_9MAGN
MGMVNLIMSWEWMQCGSDVYVFSPSRLFLVVMMFGDLGFLLGHWKMWSQLSGVGKLEDMTDLNISADEVVLMEESRIVWVMASSHRVLGGYGRQKTGVGVVGFLIHGYSFLVFGEGDNEGCKLGENLRSPHCPARPMEQGFSTFCSPRVAAPNLEAVTYVERRGPEALSLY